MAKQFLRQITFMCLMLMLGIANWVAAPLVSKMWLYLLSFASAIFAFFLAYICYRKARKIAEEIDDLRATKMVIIRSSSTEAQQPDTKESEEEHEDIGHPV